MIRDAILVSDKQDNLTLAEVFDGRA